MRWEGFGVTTIMSSITLGIVHLATMFLGRLGISVDSTILSKIALPNLDQNHKPPFPAMFKFEVCTCIPM